MIQPEARTREGLVELRAKLIEQLMPAVELADIDAIRICAFLTSQQGEALRLTEKPDDAESVSARFKHEVPRPKRHRKGGHTMTTESTIEATFADLLRAALSPTDDLHAEVDPTQFSRGRDGITEFLLPTQKLVVIDTPQIPTEEVVGSLEWLSDAPLMELVRVVEVTQTKGRVPVGRTLGATTIQTETTSATGYSDPVIGDVPYALERVVEARTQVSQQAVIQNPENADAIETAHRLALMEALQKIVLVGEGSAVAATATVSSGAVDSVTVTDGGSGFVKVPEVRFVGGGGSGAQGTVKLTDGEVTGVTIVDGGSNYTSAPAVVIGSGAIHAAAGRKTYAMNNRGHSDDFLDGEEAVQDADARLGGMAWFVGKSLHSSAARTLIEPGSDRRTLESGRLQLTGVRAYRNSDLVSTDGVLFDWRNGLVAVMHDTIHYVVDSVTKPGSIKLTSRLSFDVLFVRPALGYLLEQA